MDKIKIVAEIPWVALGLIIIGVFLTLFTAAFRIFGMIFDFAWGLS